MAYAKRKYRYNNIARAVSGAYNLYKRYKRAPKRAVRRKTKRTFRGRTKTSTRTRYRRSLGIAHGSGGVTTDQRVVTWKAKGRAKQFAYDGMPFVTRVNNGNRIIADYGKQAVDFQTINSPGNYNDMIIKKILNDSPTISPINPTNIVNTKWFLGQTKLEYRYVNTGPITIEMDLYILSAKSSRPPAGLLQPTNAWNLGYTQQESNTDTGTPTAADPYTKPTESVKFNQNYKIDTLIKKKLEPGAEYVFKYFFNPNMVVNGAWLQENGQIRRLTKTLMIVCRGMPVASKEVSPGITTAPVRLIYTRTQSTSIRGIKAYGQVYDYTNGLPSSGLTELYGMKEEQEEPVDVLDDDNYAE